MFYHRIKRFLEEDRAQDLIEYTLLLGFVALVSAGLMAQTGIGIQGIWSTSNSTLVQANSTSPASQTGGHHGDHGDGR